MCSGCTACGRSTQPGRGNTGIGLPKSTVTASDMADRRGPVTGTFVRRNRACDRRAATSQAYAGNIVRKEGTFARGAVLKEDNCVGLLSAACGPGRRKRGRNWGWPFGEVREENGAHAATRAVGTSDPAVLQSSFRLPGGVGGGPHRLIDHGAPV